MEGLAVAERKKKSTKHSKKVTSALAAFQRLMNAVLQPFLDKRVLAYLDDIAIFSKKVWRTHGSFDQGIRIIERKRRVACTTFRIWIRKKRFKVSCACSFRWRHRIASLLVPHEIPRRRCLASRSILSRAKWGHYAGTAFVDMVIKRVVLSQRILSTMRMASHSSILQSGVKVRTFANHYLC